MLLWYFYLCPFSSCLCDLWENVTMCVCHLPNAHVYLNTSYFNFDMPIILRVYRLACPFRFTFFAPLSFSIYSLPTFVRCVVFCEHWTKKCHFPPNDLYAFPYLLITLYSHHGCIYHCKASENTSFIFIDWFDTEQKKRHSHRANRKWLV